jgi:hypothetical protein
MAIINTAKGLIITGGLGGPACCALLTANIFSLVCGCSFQVFQPGNAGGGYYPYHVVTPYYTPWRAPAQDTCLVLVDIKLGDNHWRKSYVVDRGRGDTIITIVKVFNKVRAGVTAAATSVKRVAKKALVYFTPKDK